MSKAPPEVQPPVQLLGTTGADVILAIAAVVTADPFFEGAPNSLKVYALNGDDGIVRDRTGTYGGFDFEYTDTLIDGGAGSDIVNYNSADGPITARLDQVNELGFSLITSPALPFPGENGWVRGADRVKNVEGVAGTVFDDDLRGNGLANRLWGHDGDDAIRGNGGHDQLYGGLGEDHIWGGEGNDLIDGGDGDDYLHGGKGADTINAGAGDDEILGHDDNDVIKAGDGDDYVRGGKGNDVIHGGDGSNDLYGDEGNDTIHLSGFGWNDVDGGSGTDTVVFTQTTLVNLFNGFAWRGPQGLDGEDDIAGVENVTTGNHDDVVLADDARNVIRTNDGDDWVMTLGGDDEIVAGAGDDTVLGDDGEDEIDGGDGADRLHGGDGDDDIVGGRGADRVRGGEGADTINLGRVSRIGQSDTERDVLVWEAGDVGMDVVRNFTVAHDRLNFDEGFLAAGPVADNLLVFDSGDDALLAANMAGVGWDFIASFEDVSAIALTNAIENGSIFDVQTTGLGDDAPGGFAPGDNSFEIGVVLGVQFMI